MVYNLYLKLQEMGHNYPERSRTNGGSGLLIQWLSHWSWESWNGAHLQENLILDMLQNNVSHKFDKSLVNYLVRLAVSTIDAKAMKEGVCCVFTVKVTREQLELWVLASVFLCLHFLQRIMFIENMFSPKFCTPLAIFNVHRVH